MSTAQAETFPGAVSPSAGRSIEPPLVEGWDFDILLNFSLNGATFRYFTFRPSFSLTLPILKISVAVVFDNLIAKGLPVDYRWNLVK